MTSGNGTERRSSGDADFRCWGYRRHRRYCPKMSFMTLIGLNNLGCRGYVLGATLEWCRQYSDIAIHELMTPTATTTNPMYQRGYELDLDQ
jgi:hypothetical protein